jgi:hypothetical protein
MSEGKADGATLSTPHPEIDPTPIASARTKTLLWLDFTLTLHAGWNKPAMSIAGALTRGTAYRGQVGLPAKDRAVEFLA